jgi:hypothetical protein
MSVTFSIRRNGQWLYDEHEVNMCNANAIMVLMDLGQNPMTDDGTVGQVEDLPAFIAMCDAVLASIAGDPSLDPGRKTVEYSSPGRATVIDCGTPAGYLQRQVTALRKLAMLAQDAGGVLCWA